MIRLSDISIKTKLIIYTALIIILISVSISLSSYKASEDAIKKQAGQLVSTSVEQVMKRTDLFLKNIHLNAMNIAFDKNLIKMMSNTQLENYEDFYNVLEYSNYLQTFKNINAYVESVYIYDLKHMIYLSSNGRKNSIVSSDEDYIILKENFINKRQYEAPQYLWLANRAPRHLKDSDKVISFIIPVRQNNGSLLGALIINILEKSIAYIYEETALVNSGEFYIADPDGGIVSTVNKSNIGSKIDIPGLGAVKNEKSSIILINGREHLVTAFTSDYMGWKYISMIPMNKLMEDNIRNVRNVLISIAGITVLIFIVFSFFFNSIFFKPVIALINRLRLSVQDHSELNFIVNRKDEIGFIFGSVNDILKENNKLIKEVYEQKIALKTSELRSLQSQINPHFLYNSLNTAIGSIKLNESKKAIYIIDSLIKLFRVSLGKSREFITVRQELEYLNSYITIQKIRYNDKISFDADIQEDIMEYKIVKLLLQPLIENSIYHGIANKKGMGRIKITGKKEEGLLKFIVEDNGTGISEEKMEEIRQMIASDEFDSENFYALQNINKRVKLYYGEEYGISLESREYEWTKVILTLPVVES